MDSVFCLKSTTEIKKRKAAGWAKRTIKSVASWWWLNVHDEKCTDGFDIPDWIKKFPVVKMNETYDFWNIWGETKPKNVILVSNNYFN